MSLLFCFNEMLVWSDLPCIFTELEINRKNVQESATEYDYVNVINKQIILHKNKERSTPCLHHTLQSLSLSDTYWIYNGTGNEPFGSIPDKWALKFIKKVWIYVINASWFTCLWVKTIYKFEILIVQGSLWRDMLFCAHHGYITGVKTDICNTRNLSSFFFQLWEFIMTLLFL